MDQAWGSFPLIGTRRERETASIRRPWVADHRLLERLFAAPGFREIYLREYERIFREQFNVARLAAESRSLAALVRPTVLEESGLSGGPVRPRPSGHLAGRGARAEHFRSVPTCAPHPSVPDPAGGIRGGAVGWPGDGTRVPDPPEPHATAPAAAEFGVEFSGGREAMTLRRCAAAG